MSADLSDAEVDAICDGLSQNAAKVRFLESLGVTVKRKPNGKPLVNRAHYELVRGGSQAQNGVAQAPGKIVWSN